MLERIENSPSHRNTYKSRRTIKFVISETFVRSFVKMVCRLARSGVSLLLGVQNSLKRNYRNEFKCTRSCGMIYRTQLKFESIINRSYSRHCDRIACSRSRVLLMVGFFTCHSVCSSYCSRC